MTRRDWIRGVAAAGAAAVAGGGTARAGGKGYRLVWDDFRDGFTVAGVPGAAGAKWFYFGAGPFVGNDGVETTTRQGLSVRASGTNPGTGEPAFQLTVGQEGAPDNPFGLPGGLDHVKWLVYMNHLAGTGVPGFDAVPGQVLGFESWIRGRSYGTAGHPFGAGVADPDDDLRLGSVAANGIDFETFMVFDFFFTNKRVYAFYERLPFGRGPVLGNYAAFSYMIPVADRRPDDWHHTRMAYDRAAGTFRWFLDGDEVFAVDRIGRRIDREYLTIDHGGDEVDVEPRQLAGGMGMFTLLDGSLPSGEGLVRLSTAEDFYFDPAEDEPTPQTFLDEDSDPASRLFGQGTELRVRRAVVSSRPAGDD
jgi:hypothetical protein